MLSDAQKLSEARRIASLIVACGRPGAGARISAVLDEEMSDHDHLTALHREFGVLLKRGEVPAHLRHGVEELLLAQSDSAVVEKLAEARHLASLLAAHGHAGARARILEILENPMSDAARLEMLRYEAASLICDLPPEHPLARRFRAFTES